MGQGNIIGKSNLPATTSAKGVWSLREQNAANRASAWPGYDPQWSNTRLLLKTTSTAADTFIDSSPANVTVTRAGDTIQTTATPYAPYWSAYFDGSGDYLTAPSPSGQLGSGDFTVEVWVYPTARVSTYPTVWGNYSTWGAGSLALFAGHGSANTAKYQVSCNGTFPAIQSTADIIYNQWTHLAVVRSGGTITLYVNGVANGTFASTATLNQANTSWIGVAGDSISSGYFNGYISNLRVVAGTAVYTSGFTPPTAPLTAITGTILLTCQDNRFKDNSANALSITKTGDVAVSRFAPFAWTWSAASGGSACFDGSGDYLSAPNAVANFTNQNFTAECWQYFTTNSIGYQPIMCNTGTGDAQGWIITTETNNYVYCYFSTGAGSWAYSIATTYLPTVNAWTHFALVRNGVTITLYANGVSIGSTNVGAASIYSPSGGFYAGYYPYYPGGARSLTGYMANIRLVAGTAVYTANFTPPTGPVSAVSGTSLLLNFTNAAYRDTSGLASVIRQYGATTSRGYLAPSTELTNVGFAVNGDYLSASAPSGYLGGGDFTVEGWVYPIAKVGAYPVMWCNYTSWATGCFGLFIGHNSTPTKYTIGLNATDAVITSKSDIVYNQWTHLAAVRSNGVITLYVNGVAEGTYSTTTVFNQGSGTSFLSVPGDATTNSTFGGLVSNLRIERAARYTANFTPSTAPHTPTKNTILLLDQVVDTWDATGRNNLANNATITPTPAMLAGSALSLNGSQLARATSGTLSSDFAFGTGDFTIEAWIYPTSSSGDRCIFSTRGAQANAIYFGHYTNAYTLGFYTASAWQVTSNVAVAANTWSHVACVRANGVIYLYINGMCVGSAANTTNLSESTAAVGRSVADNAYGYVGQIAELRVTRSARYTGNFTVSPTPYSKDWEPPYNDTFYTSNALQVKTIDLPGATNNVFRDDSANNFLPVRYGDVTQGSLSPYIPSGYWSGANLGGSNRITAASSTAFEHGTGDFTIEGWIMPLTWGNSTTLFCHWDGGGTARFAVGLSSTAIGFDGTYGMTSLTGNYACNAQLGVWHHVAVTRQGSTFRLFLNGILVGSSTYSGSYLPTGVPFHIGGYADGYTTGTSHISNLRVVKGTALYTANFTPPTSPLTAITGTSLLACQDNRFIDRSTNNFALTRNGSPEIARSSPFPFAPPVTTVATTSSPGSVYFDGVGDYCTTSGGTGLVLDGDFTVEGWVSLTGTASDQTFVNFAPHNTIAVSLNRGGTGKTCVFIGNGSGWYATPTIQSTNTLAFNTWHHIALVRNGGTLTLYHNGTNVGTTTYVPSGFNGGLQFGRIVTYDQEYLTGYISNLRVIKGTALYTANFTPPTSALTAISGTTFLTAQSSSLIDASANGYAITRTGDARATSDLSPFPTTKRATYTYGGSGYFDGSGDYLMCPTGYLTNIGTGNFTIEGWWNFQDFTIRTTYYQRLWSFGTGTTNDVALNVSDTGYLTYRNNDAVLISASAPMILNTWAHVALVRNSGTTTLYLNGVSVGSTTTNNNLTTPAASPFYVGSEVGAGGYFIGHAANIRVTNTAVYTAAFTPPTSPVTAISGTSLLLNFDNAGVYDATGRQNILTRGATATSSTRSKYEIATLAFNGTDNTSINPVPVTSHFAFGAGDFTIEFWLYRNTQNQEVFYDQRPYTTQGAYPTIYCENATLYYYVGGGNQINGGTLSASTWYHIAVSRANSQTRLFVNGTQVGGTYADTNSYLCGAGRPQLGNSYYNSTTEYRINSYIEGLRVSRVGRYTANFTVPSEPFPMK